MWRCEVWGGHDVVMIKKNKGQRMRDCVHVQYLCVRVCVLWGCHGSIRLPCYWEAANWKWQCSWHNLRVTNQHNTLQSNWQTAVPWCMHEWMQTPRQLIRHHTQGLFLRTSVRTFSMPQCKMCACISTCSTLPSLPLFCFTVCIYASVSVCPLKVKIKFVYLQKS